MSLRSSMYNGARPESREAVYAEWRREWNAGGRRPITGDNWKRVAAAVLKRVAERKREA